MIMVEHLSAGPPPPSSSPDLAALTWEERCKTRQTVTTQGGREIGIKLPTGTRLLPGTLLYVGDGFHVLVAAAPENIWLIQATDAPQLARVAYEIGNRHFAIEFGDGTVAVLYDHTLQELWHRLGVTAQRVRRPFQPEQHPPDPHR
jgi:urease accessory protein